MLCEMPAVDVALLWGCAHVPHWSLKPNALRPMCMHVCVFCVYSVCCLHVCTRAASVVFPLCCHCTIAAVHAGVSGQVSAAIHGPSDRYSTGAAMQALPLGTFSPSSPSITQ